MITSNSFIDGITQRRIKGELLNEFNEIYILDLHGNNRKGEAAQMGVCIKMDLIFKDLINFLLKKLIIMKLFSYFDLWGLKKYKYEWLIKI